MTDDASSDHADLCDALQLAASAEPSRTNDTVNVVAGQWRSPRSDAALRACAC